MQSSRWNYFSDDEVAGLSTEFVAQLDVARHAAGVAFTITSALRTPSENTACGGVGDSSHCEGLAVDLEAPSGVIRFAIVKGALAAGLTRIGIYDHHVHLDADLTKVQNDIWTGISH